MKVEKKQQACKKAECKQKTKREKMRKKIFNERKMLCKGELLSYIDQKVRRPEIKKRRRVLKKEGEERNVLLDSWKRGHAEAIGMSQKLFSWFL